MRQTFHPRNIIVTGGCGFIGSNFVRYVVREHPGVHVTVLDKLTYAGNPENIAGLPADRVELVVGDVCDAALLDELVPGHDAIVHYAAESHNDNSIADPGPFLRTNVEGTFRLLEAVRRYGVRYHHVSTDEVYGDLALDDPARFTEEHPVPPEQPVLLHQGELRHARPRLDPHLWPAHDHLQLLEQLRPLPARGEVHPPPDHQRHRRRAPQALRQGRERPRLDPHRGPQLGRLGHPHEAAAWGRPTSSARTASATNIDVLRMILEAMGKDPDDFDWVRDRPGHDRRYAIDSTKLRRELGWEPRHTDFAEGLRQTIAWYVDNEDWWRPAKAATEARYKAQGQ